MNTVLERQLKKVFGSLENVPPGFEVLLKMVSDAYNHADEDRLLVERSLELSSRELGELNARIKKDADHLKNKIDELTRMNRLMVDRELKMMELKKEIEALKRGAQT